MIYDGRVYIDNTIYKSTFSCSLQLVLRHVLKWNSREESVHLLAGTAMHEAQAVWNRMIIAGASNQACRDAALAEFARLYAAYANEWVAPDDRMDYNNLFTILDEWFTTRYGKLPWTVPDTRLIEVGFAYPLDTEGRVVAFGRMDLIAQDVRDGSWVVVDHKSTGRLSIDWVEQWSIDSQVSQYYWAALQHVANLRGFYVSGIEFSKLPASDRKCTKHGLPYSKCQRAHMNAQIVGPIDRAPKMLERWYADALIGATKYRYYAETYNPEEVGTTPDLSNVEVEGPFTGACRFCTFKDFCRTGRNENMLPAMYIQDEWAPFDPRAFENADPVAEVLG